MRDKASIFIVILVAISITIPSTGHAWGHWGWYGAGAFTGGVLLGAAIARPWYYAPAPVYVYPTPPVVYAAPPGYAVQPPVYAPQVRPTPTPTRLMPHRPRARLLCLQGPRVRHLRGSGLTCRASL